MMLNFKIKNYHTLKYLSEGVEKHHKDYTELVAQYISKKTGFDEKDVMQIIGSVGCKI